MMMMLVLMMFAHVAQNKLDVGLLQMLLIFIFFFVYKYLVFLLPFHGELSSVLYKGSLPPLRNSSVNKVV